jgi:hypothetical protein
MTSNTMKMNLRCAGVLLLSGLGATVDGRHKIRTQSKPLRLFPAENVVVESVGAW